MIASAPGKVILFGEHAVVYGRRAVVTAINRRCYAEVKRSSDFSIQSKVGVSGLDFKKHPYISYAVKRFRELRKVEGAEIKIDSEIPLGSGLGSSSAVTVSVLGALNAEFEGGLTREDVFEIARSVELDVQGKGSGIDPYISTYGGTWLTPDKKQFNIEGLQFVVVDSQQSSSTRKMVSRVARLRDEYPSIIDAVFDVIGHISVSSVEHLQNKDLQALSRLMHFNQCMLQSIEISTEIIDLLVQNLSRAGITAKITGAGGGGCVVGVGDEKSIQKALEEYPAFLLEPEKEGVRIED
ncbi:MAG: mevalonate kinase [Archaeoglobaceae archaeon]